MPKHQMKNWFIYTILKSHKRLSKYRETDRCHVFHDKRNMKKINSPLSSYHKDKYRDLESLIAATGLLSVFIMRKQRRL